MPTDILISSDPWENRVAILEDGGLAEIYIEREEKVIGSIYKAKVQNVLPGMGASFVDIGLGRNAFLYVDDIHKAPLNIGDVEITQGRSGWTITDKVNRGDDVLVQIVKEPRGLKGARVSTNITLPGRYLILMPTGKYSGVSRKIESADERTRLKNVMKRIRPDGMATVVRTAAAGVSDAELIADLGVLIRMWHGILENYKGSPAPSLIHKDMNLVFKAARDFITPQIERVLVDNAAECEKLKDFMRLLGPQYVDRITFYPQGRALFRDFKVEDELVRLMRPKVNLPSGGSLVIETTEALTVIDVNSGKYSGGKTQEDTILHTNLEAAAEIARQVRLRDIGGMIVCDFIDMSHESSRTKVLNVLETGLRRDRTRSTIQSFSALGLLEFTRKRIGKDLGGQLQAACPTCRGNGNVLSPESVAIDAFRAIRAHAGHHHDKSEGIAVVTPPTVAAQMRFWYDEELQGLEKELGEKISIIVDPLLHPEKTRLSTPSRAIGAATETAPTVIRVGDELEVDVLTLRMPNPTSAAAVIGGKLVEIENASNSMGGTLAIRILDVDEATDEILAEPRAPVAGAVDGRKRRRRGGRGRALTPVEQAEELRELAEEAARGLGSRTAPQPEPERPAVAARTESAPEAAGDGAAPAEGSEEFKRKRRRRRRRGGRDAGNSQFFGEPGATPPPSGISASAAAPADGSAADEGDEEEDDEPTTAETPGGEPSDQPRKRRRRRRRRRGGAVPNADGTYPSNGAFIPAPGSVPERSIFRVNSAGATESTGELAPPEPSRALAPWHRRNGHVAIEPPPPSLTPPPEPADANAPRVARPSRRRAEPAERKGPAAELGARSIPALPAPKPRTTRASAAQVQPQLPIEPAPPEPRRRGRPPKAVAAAAAPAPVPARATAVKTPAARTTRQRSTTTAAPAAVAKPTAKPAVKATAKAAPVIAAAEAPKRRGRPPKAAVDAVAASVKAAKPAAAPKRTAAAPARKTAATTRSAPAAAAKKPAPAKRTTRKT